MKLLLADDDFAVRKSASTRLRAAGYAVDLADDGAKALWYAMHSEYDVILLDPVLDGLSVLKNVRRKEPTPRVLIISARGSVADRVRGLDAGADDYLVKPFAFEELLARIRVLTRRKYGQKGPVICVGDLEVDTISRRVWRDKEEIPLTLREYNLLEYLALRQGNTVYRSEIWEHLYDFVDSGCSNVVDVYVSYLRKKIDLPSQPSLIRTIRGRGYALETNR